MSRLITAVTAAAICLFALAPSALAEPKFSGGQLRLPNYGSADRYAQECAFNSRRINVAGQFGKSHDGTGQPWRQGNRLATLSLSASPRTRRGVAIGTWRKQRIPGGEIIFGTGFDSAGRLYYVTGKPILRGRDRTLHVLRTTSSGRLDRAFGARGMITLTNVGRFVRDNYQLRARVVPAGSRALVVLSASGFTEIHRINRKGVDRTWTPYRSAFKTGRLNLSMAESVAAGPDGSVYAGATAVINGQPQPGTGLVKLLPTGRIDRSFGTDGVWDAPRIEDTAYSLSNPRSTGPSVLGVSSGVVVNATGGLTVAVENSHSVSTFAISVFRFVEVDAAGTTTSISAPKGTYSFGGDTGFPLAFPRHFGPSKQGASLAMANGWFDGTSARTDGLVTSSSQTSEQQLDLKNFAVTAFAGDQRSSNLLACGVLANELKGDGRQQAIALKTIEAK